MCAGSGFERVLHGRARSPSSVFSVVPVDRPPAADGKASGNCYGLGVYWTTDGKLGVEEFGLKPTVMQLHGY